MKIMVRWNSMKIKRDINISLLLQKMRSGFQMLAHIDWVSAYGSHLSAATVLGVVGLLLAVRDGRMGKFNNLLLLSARNNGSEKLFFVPGLRNLGNNCFLNVVLQSLASCSSFRCFLEDVKSLQTSYRVEQDEDFPLLVSLADLLEELSAPTSRILSREKMEDLKEPKRWRQQYLGPFDGILGSFLTCQSCSSEIIMDFSFFHTLPLSLISCSGAYILDRSTLEDYIQRFLAPEYVENYSCSHCWHIAAVKYLSSVGGLQDEIEKLSCCGEQDSCDCKNISSVQTLPWSNRFSRASKKFNIAYCPKILCFHLQRSSYNAFGELVKIQGHIKFPMILNLSAFIKSEVSILEREVNKPSVKEQPYLAATFRFKSEDKHIDPFVDASQLSLEPCLSLTATDSYAKLMHSLKVTSDPPPPETISYRLVSVVEHFGRAGSGHYTVYRGVRNEPGGVDDNVGGIDTDTHLEWFRISDSEVHKASEVDVLGAEATLLFYERI
ncbi:ubiquitin carboxyl-terminal hydrolase 27 isoform X3 [Amaranthus tricolor]|uniref:ubiquitin carboxyl-terminal hydrolase 27 isoform X3 n=1 Tax=Amaranthus tricolor TaxID=29722 RepID=UPI00258EFFE5|nr:ubiquitin carboxyl-terminal hydrolase 27 isoform X3 [Amaranthus tricolor]